MANAAKMLGSQPVRAFIVGYPGAGKTGSLVSLLNAGYRILFLDYDGNTEPLIRYANPAMLKNLDIVHLEDQMRMGSGFIEPAGIPTAFAAGYSLIKDGWKYKEPDGTEVNLGKPSEWGLETIVVCDSLTKNGDAAFRRAMKLMNKTPLNTTDRVWGLAMAEQHAFVEQLFSKSNRFHTLLLAHFKMVGPKDQRSGDTDLTKELKEKIASLIDTRLYPSALGWQLPQNIGGEAPTILEVRSKVVAGKVKHVIITKPRPEFDVKVPAGVDLPSELDISDGMLTIFKALCPASVELVSQQRANGETK